MPIKKKKLNKNETKVMVNLMSKDRVAFYDTDELTKALRYPIRKLFDFENKRQLAGRFNCKCPVCSGKQTFFIMENNHFKCFNCEWTGNSIDFIKAIKGYSYNKSVMYIISL